MSDTDGTESTHGSGAILTSSLADGSRVQLVQRSDGSFAIAQAGNGQSVYDLGSRNLEMCTRTFMAFLQSCRDGDESITIE